MPPRPPKPPGRYRLAALRLLRERRLPIVVTSAVSLGTAIGLLVLWVATILRSAQRINELAARLGVTGEDVASKVLWVGCVAFFLLIVALTYQAVQALAARTRSMQQEEFLSNVTHELKSPLAAIRLQAQTLQQEGIDESTRLRFADRILEQTTRMGSLVDNILESSRLQSRRRLLDLEPIALRPFLEELLEEWGRSQGENGPALVVRLETESKVMATPDSLRRILRNLLENAQRHAREVEEITCSAEDRGSRVRIAVEDDGVGIPRRELRRIFDRFHQLRDSGEAKRVGTGLGLSIVRGLVAELGGSIRAQHREPRGTRFEIVLPRCDG